MQGTAEVAQEVGVHFHHRDVNAGAGQRQTEHHGCRPTAGDQTRGFVRLLEHA